MKIIPALIVTTLIIAMAIMPLLHQNTTPFPKPSGDYGVGIKKYHWVDTTRIEPYSNDSAHPHRELMAYIYYPVQTKLNHPSYSYDAQAAQSAADFIHHKSHIPYPLLPDFSKIKTYAQPD